MHNIFIETIPFLQQHTTHTVPHKAFCVKKIICRRRKKKSKNTFYFFYTKRFMGHSSGERSGLGRPPNRRRVLAVFLKEAQHSREKQLAGNNCCRITSSTEKYDFFLLLLYFYIFCAWPRCVADDDHSRREPRNGSESFRWTQKHCPIAPKLPRNYFTQRKKKNKTKELKYDF